MDIWMSLEIQDFFCWKPSLIWAFFFPLGWQTKNPWHIEPCCGFQVGRYRGCGRQFSTVYSQYIAQVLKRNFAFRHLFTSKQHCKTLQHGFCALKETSKHRQIFPLPSTLLSSNAHRTPWWKKLQCRKVLRQPWQCDKSSWRSK